MPNPNKTLEKEPAGVSDSRVLLEARDVKKSFGGLQAVDGVSFTLEPGGFLSIMGPNGAGKSTLFKLLMGTDTPDSGEILFRGDNIVDLMPYERSRRGISLKFQTNSIFQSLTVQQNLQIARLSRTRDNDSDVLENFIDATDLDDHATHRARNLSHCHQQWLEMAMALSSSPSLLLLDEPTAGLTRDETKKTAELLLQLNEQGIAIIVVEHDVQFIRQLGHRTMILHRGRIFFEGTPQEVSANQDVQEIYLGKEEENSDS